MSHIVTIQTRIRDRQALEAACRRLKLPSAKEATVDFFSGSVHGWAVELPGWVYPVVVDPASGQLHYDNYEGRWGQEQELHRLLQAYAVEKAKLEARRQGYRCHEILLSNGTIRLELSPWDEDASEIS